MDSKINSLLSLLIPPEPLEAESPDQQAEKKAKAKMGGKFKPRKFAKKKTTRKDYQRVERRDRQPD